MFGEVSWQATDKLSFTVGARWYSQDQDYALQQGGLLEGNKVNPERDYLSNNESKQFSEDNWVPKLNVTYEITDDVMTYVTYSEGFRSGGVNPLRAKSLLPPDYESDKLKNFEVGIKSEWLGNTLRLNTVAYHMQWDDMQIQVNDPAIFSLGIVNFSEAEIDGFEADLTWLPADGWDITANVGFLNAEISEDNIITGPNGTVIANVANGT